MLVMVISPNDQHKENNICKCTKVGFVPVPQNEAVPQEW